MTEYPLNFTDETILSFVKSNELYDKVFFQVLARYETIQVWFGSDKKYKREEFRSLYFPGVIVEYYPYPVTLINIDSINRTIEIFLATRGYKLEERFDSVNTCSEWSGRGCLSISSVKK